MARWCTIQVVYFKYGKGRPGGSFGISMICTIVLARNVGGTFERASRLPAALWFSERGQRAFTQSEVLANCRTAVKTEVEVSCERCPRSMLTRTSAPGPTVLQLRNQRSGTSSFCLLVLRHSTAADTAHNPIGDAWIACSGPRNWDVDPLSTANRLFRDLPGCFFAHRQSHCVSKSSRFPRNARMCRWTAEPLTHVT
jgi:hypothetical protein